MIGNVDDVIYCEFLFMSEPREMQMSLERATTKFNSIMKVLGTTYKDTIMEAGSFVGVKDQSGKWIMKNTE